MTGMPRSSSVCPCEGKAEDAPVKVCGGTLAELAGALYGGENFNCSESILRAGAELWKIVLPPEALLVAAGFGGGMGIESSCGALTGGIMVLSLLFTREKAHCTPNLKVLCSGFLRRFEERHGSICCAELKKKYRSETAKCRPVVAMAGDVLQEMVEEELRRTGDLERAQGS